MRRMQMLKSLLLVPLVVLSTGGARAFAKVSSTMTQYSTIDPDKSPWALSLSAAGKRGLGYQQESWDLMTNVSAIRTFKNGHLASASIGYQSILYREYNNRVFDRYDAHPEQYGLTDLAVSYLMPGAYEAEPFTLTPNFKLTLPTSTISREASLIASVDSGLDIDISINKWLSLSPSIGVGVRQYQYDDANKAGTVTNSPFALDYGLAVTTKPLERFILGASYGQTQRYDYQSVWTLMQAAAVHTQYGITKQIEVNAAYRWQDEIISNEPAFAYDKSAVIVGLKVTVQ